MDVTNNKKEINLKQAEAEVRETKKQIGYLRPKPGHKLFKFKDGHISEVTDDEYEDSVVEISNTKLMNIRLRDNDRRRGRKAPKKKPLTKPKTKTRIRKKLVVKEGYTYMSAFNIKNAAKKFQKTGKVVKLKYFK